MTQSPKTDTGSGSSDTGGGPRLFRSARQRFGQPDRRMETREVAGRLVLSTRPR
ncbi:hypothetical protein M2390_002639 [Mycetocola sp. BIGb0189]|uniref:hypothetical protein n=1 Tax=Mycetocola sp. BIGb0189 TaxID=2940604 RepID=UPI00216876E1|nr:hypothetical protein [Mycetocola sp. BIGb0189]MCS4277433.1 hypothetical protein [Mycetocola sp. BIGb0189]